MKIAFFSSKTYDSEYFKKINSAFSHELTFFEARLKQSTAKLAAGFDAVCVFVNDKLDAETIKLLKKNGVKAIALRCAGFNNVDLTAAHKANIPVLRVPAYSPHAVAEHALALILTLNRKTHKAFNRVREGNFSLERLTGFNVYKKTMGVIGTGRIGAVFCEIMLGMGCRVLAYDHYQNKVLEEKGVVYCSELEDVLKQSDIVSLHCPLSSETHHIINKKALDMMKKGAMLINTSRGGLINTKDVVAALKSQQLGYLGIDVYEQEEKLFFKDLSEIIIEDDLIARLVSFPNVLITAHQAFFTSEALNQISTVTLQNLSDFENGKQSENEVKVEP